MACFCVRQQTIIFSLGKNRIANCFVACLILTSDLLLLKFMLFPAFLSDSHSRCLQLAQTPNIIGQQRIPHLSNLATLFIAQINEHKQPLPACALFFLAEKATPHSHTVLKLIAHFINSFSLYFSRCINKGKLIVRLLYQYILMTPVEKSISAERCYFMYILQVKKLNFKGPNAKEEKAKCTISFVYLSMASWLDEGPVCILIDQQGT